jgi:phage terminase large subunit
MKIAGLDVADEGGDDNALIRRHGVVVTDKDIDSWKEGNTTETTRKAYSICEESGTDVLKYDSIGVGAGVKGEVWSLQKIKKKKIQAVGVNTGAAPTSGNFAPGKTNEDMFANLKAQLWWEMRRRFQRTFNFKNGETNIPHDQLISIPNHRQLVMELSQPKYGHKENGKIIIESKKSMKIRGIKSPNFADALIICFSREIGLNYNMLTSK